MSDDIDRPALQQLAALLLDRVGLKITPDGYYGLRLALKARMPSLGLTDASEYVRRLRPVTGEAELRSLLPLVTVGKTEFFRDTRQFRAIEETLIPQYLSKARQEGRKLRIWSAGCATGEEPYSLGIVALESRARPADVDVWATDLNPAAVEKASLGCFPTRRLVGVSEDRLMKYFTPIESGYQVVPILKTFIRFESHNLAAPLFPTIAAGSLDLILCRNVIIYFDQPTIRSLMDRFFEALRPGAVLLLGYSESLFRMATRFEMFEVNGTFAYRRPIPGVVVVPPRGSAPRPSSPIPPPAPSRPSGQHPIVPASAPSAPSAPRPAPASPPIPIPESRASRPTVPVLSEAHRSPVERLDKVIALIEKGDFSQALLGARRLADDQPEDLAALLTLGNIHALMGNVDEARDLFELTLTKEPLCVEARVYLAVAAIQSQQYDTARIELTRALFLEPTLALANYLMAQVQEQRGDFEAARRAYKNAIALRKGSPHALLGHFPEMPTTNEAVAQAAAYRLAALSEA